MANKPNDFYIGVIDFFSIFIPGAVLLFLEQAKIREIGEPDLYALSGGTPPDSASWIIWTAFAVCSYVSGHFLFMVGRKLNLIHDDNFRQKPQISLLDQASNAVRSKLNLNNDVKNNSVLLRKMKIYILLHSSSGFSEIERQLANYKFFRTLTVVFGIDAILSIFPPFNALRLALSIVLVIVCFLRFKNLREETEQLTLTMFEFLIEKDQPPKTALEPNVEK